MAECRPPAPILRLIIIRGVAAGASSFVLSATADIAEPSLSVYQHLALMVTLWVLSCAYGAACVQRRYSDEERS